MGDSDTYRAINDLNAGRTMADIQAERDRWIRLFNRLEAAVTHHKRAQGALATDADEALYAAREKILRDAAKRD